VGWIKKKPKTPTKHECKPPRAQKVGVGSTWRCDDCAQAWIVWVDANSMFVTERGAFKSGMEPVHLWREATNEEVYPLPEPPSGKSGTPAVRDANGRIRFVNVDESDTPTKRIVNNGGGPNG